MENIADSIKNNWENIKKTIKSEFELSDTSYRTWVEPLKFYNIENNTVIITSDQPNLLDYITKKYSVFFQVTINEMFNTEYNVSFILESDIQSTSSEKTDNEEDNSRKNNF